ncbi:hypothetical protein [Octadecabacter sp. R77987]|uniref:hypothetical protein n=1 Tax=Octadecabacter sp. R77987 TaxID=3093874 RepID=UPI003670A0DE
MKLMQNLFAAKLADGLDPVRDALLAAQIVDTADIWHPVATLAVGGLVAVGFDRKSEEMLVVSAHGQSVFDCRNGAIRYQDEHADGYDAPPLKAARLDHPAAERFDMAGRDGGGLRSVTRDGWRVARINLCWPETYCILQPPKASIHALARVQQDQDTTFYLMAKERTDIRAFGFSWTGESLVLATASDLHIWTRETLKLTNPS